MITITDSCWCKSRVWFGEGGGGDGSLLAREESGARIKSVLPGDD